MPTTTGATAAQVAIQVITDTYAVLAIPYKGDATPVYEELSRQEAISKWAGLHEGYGVRKYVVQKEGLSYTEGLTFSIKDAWMGFNPVQEAEKILLTVNTERSQSHPVSIEEKRFARDLRWIDKMERQGRLVFRLPKRRRAKGRVKAHNTAQQQRWQNFIREDHKFSPFDGNTQEADLSEEEVYFSEAHEAGIRQIGNKAWNIAFPKVRVTAKQAKRARQKANRGKRQVFRRPTTPKTVKIVRKGTMCKGTKVNGDRCSRRLPTKAPFCHQHTQVVYTVVQITENVQQDRKVQRKEQ